MSRRIRFVLDRAESYEGVQDQLLNLIDAHLPEPKPERGDHRAGDLNFCLFIRPESDVVMSHGVADKNYLWSSDGQGRRLATRRSTCSCPVSG